MADFSGIFSPSQAPTPSPATGRFAGVFSAPKTPAPTAAPSAPATAPAGPAPATTAPNTAPVATTGAGPSSVPSISPSTTPNAFAGSLGGGYGASNVIDQYSGKPLLTFENNGTEASQLLPDRTAPSFDPTVAQPVSKDMLYNGRMPESVSQAIKAQFPGSVADELDHIMPLELGGSNNKSNLRLEPGQNPNERYSPSTNPTQTDPLENSLAQQVYSGKISLVQAWQLMAQAKGLTLPEQGGPIPSNANLQNDKDVQAPSLWDNIVSGVKTAAGGVETGLNDFLGAAQKVKSFDRNVATNVDNAVGNAIKNPKSTGISALMSSENFGLGIAKAFVGTTGFLGNKQAPAAMKWLNDNQDAINELAQKNFANTPAKQDAYTVGNIIGSILPYYLTGAVVEKAVAGVTIPILSNYGGALTALQVETVGKVMKETSNVLSFFGTGQIQHANVQGSRWNQFLSDAVSLALFEGIRFSYAHFTGEMPFSTAEEKMAVLKQDAKNKAIDTINSYLPKDAQVDYGASDAEIKKAYYKAAHAVHPDVAGGSTEDMKKLNGAYSYLSSMANDSRVASTNARATTEAASPEPTETEKAQAALGGNGTEDSTSLTTASQKYMDAFNNSKGQQLIAKNGNVQFSIGDIGKNHLATTEATGKNDRLSVTDLKPTIENIKNVYRGSSDPTNHRSNTAVWIAKMPDGETRAISTKTNAKGQEEIVSAHVVSNPNYIETLKKNGIPSGTRTQITSLEGRSPFRLNERDIKNNTSISDSAMKPMQEADNKARAGLTFFGNDKPIIPEKEMPVNEGKKPSVSQEIVREPKKEVEKKPKEVYTDGNSLQEFGYDPRTSVNDEIVNVPESKPDNNSLTLGAGFDPHLDVFIEDDLKPLAKDLGENTAKVWDFAKKIVSPTNRSAASKKTAAIMREALGRMARDKEMLYETFKRVRNTLDTYSNDDSLKIIDDIEHGTPAPGFKQFTELVRNALDTRWAKIQEIKGGDAYIENYFPHIWKDPAKAKGAFAQFIGKRPLEGTKSYMKTRTIPTTMEGVALGLQPQSYNPVELVMARISDMDRFLMAHDIWTQFKEQGLRKFVGIGDKPPEGWIQVNDKISKSFQFSEVEKGLVLRGSWYMPEEAATIVNNYLSPGLVGNPLYNGFRMLSNTLNQVQLGVSGFHALFTAGDAVVSHTAAELQKVIYGKGIERVKGIVNAASAPIRAPYIVWKNITEGNKLLTAYFNKNPEIPDMVDALERAGGRVRMDSFYKNNSVRQFMKAIRKGNYIGASLRAPGALIEQIAKPIMEELVPRQKLGVFSEMATGILDKAQKENWNEYETTLRLQQAWDSVDNRMGQLVYDNLFWHKAMKDLGMASTRSLGWNLGTIRELGGGVAGYATEPIKGILKATTGKGNGAQFTPKMAYTIALPYVIGLWGAIIYYLYNHKAPETLLDYFAPKTGKTKPDGTPERIMLPSYIKDVISLSNDPVQTVVNKLHPEIGAIVDMLENHDYYGIEIRNPNDPLVNQIGELLQYQASQFVPFTVTNLINRQQAGDSSWNAYIQSFSGIMPAPAYITQTPMQKRIAALYDERFPFGIQSKAQAAASNLKLQVRTAYWLGDDTKANALLRQAVDTGVIKPKGVATFMRDADLPSDIKMFNRLAAADQESLLKNMTLMDLERYAWGSATVVKAHFSSLSPAAQQFVELVQSGTIKPPIWKRGQIANTSSSPSQ